MDSWYLMRGSFLCIQLMTPKGSAHPNPVSCSVCLIHARDFFFQKVLYPYNVLTVLTVEICSFQLLLVKKSKTMSLYRRLLKWLRQDLIILYLGVTCLVGWHWLFESEVDWVIDKTFLRVGLENMFYMWHPLA